MRFARFDQSTTGIGTPLRLQWKPTVCTTKLKLRIYTQEKRVVVGTSSGIHSGGQGGKPAALVCGYGDAQSLGKRHHSTI